MPVRVLNSLDTVSPLDLERMLLWLEQRGRANILSRDLQKRGKAVSPYNTRLLIS